MLEIYLTDLQAYNEGCLVGKWIKLPLTSMELSQAIFEVLKEGEMVCGTQNHEEYFITDYEWEDVPLYEVEEYENIPELNHSLQLLCHLDHNRLKAVKFLLDQGIAADIEDAIDKSEDVIIHEDQNLEDVAYDLVHDCYGIDRLPSIIANNINYEGIADELECDGTYWELNGDVYEYIG